MEIQDTILQLVPIGAFLGLNLGFTLVLLVEGLCALFRVFLKIVGKGG